MDLRYVQALLVGDTRQKMASLATVAPIAHKAQTLRDLSRLFQAVGICRLLVDADPARFGENLIRSAQARRYFLRHAQDEHLVDSQFLGLSRSDAIFDALVVGHQGLVHDITSLSLEQWNAGRDYEDDFCYYLIVHRLATRPGFRGEREYLELIARFEKALQGQVSARLRLCKAHQAADVQAFREALEWLLEIRRMRIEEQRVGITEYTAQALFWPQSFVCMEALAWLALVEEEMPLDDDFLYCPREARELRPVTAEVEDFFVSLDQALDGIAP